ncbi:DUF2264 domain-containing protein [Cohnella zeiphila]|uniref:DUF2264 domain-containing protein n=1 Tax=Cohnella zeiphila TaxID=2761120 RepID=A0A7X0SNM1_9BACL|nr:DUF2264 domain-containing protein [Cohnella zeiphila]MBB6733333.1 DUF2264 domain-containing protein [Cohnella zeiphila]
MEIRGNRKYWLDMLVRIADPVLTALAARRLKMTMPVESIADRSVCTYLEAAGRLLGGMAPWLELPLSEGEEGELRLAYADLARRSIDAITDPGSPDYGRFGEVDQTLVDAAFLAHAIVRAPNELLGKLDGRVRANLAAALRATRVIRPYRSNWLLFSAMVETALFRMEEDYDRVRLDYAIHMHEIWYKGDGTYGDGEHFAWDYYNSYVIQPMLLDIVHTVGHTYPDGERMKERTLERAQRYAAVQEALISPEGTYPAIGRSITYRTGAFQALAQISLRKELPETLRPAQVRCALQAVIRRCMEAPGTFDANGWLKIGLAGSQPGLGEGYISTGSLYLCSTVYLPLGLPPEDDFWSDPDEPWSSRQLWSGIDRAADHAYHERH